MDSYDDIMDKVIPLRRNEGSSKVGDLKELIAAHVRPGMAIHIGQASVRWPTAALYEIARRFWGKSPAFTLIGLGHESPHRRVPPGPSREKAHRYLLRRLLSHAGAQCRFPAGLPGPERPVRVLVHTHTAASPQGRRHGAGLPAHPLSYGKHHGRGQSGSVSRYGRPVSAWGKSRPGQSAEPGHQHPSRGGFGSSREHRLSAAQRGKHIRCNGQSERRHRDGGENRHYRIHPEGTLTW